MEILQVDMGSLFLRDCILFKFFDRCHFTLGKLRVGKNSVVGRYLILK